MFTIDTSSLVAYLAGEKARDTEAVDVALRDGTAILTQPVVAEILSDPKLPKKIEQMILQLPTAELSEGYWVRVGHLRRKLLQHKRRARLADTMIAQLAIDNSLILISRDGDFKNIAQHSLLKLF